MKKTIDEKGQSIILFVFGFFSMIAMAVLIIDGGNIYLKRRSAQTAADAAALAGVYEWCINEGNLESITDVIHKYAIEENMASTSENPAVSWVLNPDEEIEVVVSFQEPTFFANIFGISTSTIMAEASAGCFYPVVGKGILPMAWACQNIEGEYEWDSEDCKYKALDWETEYFPLKNNSFGTVTITHAGDVPDTIVDLPFDFKTDLLPEIYIIGDSESISKNCGVEFNCDIDGDGKDDFQGQGDIGWLDLDGGGGPLEKEWFTDPDLELKIHSWIPSQTGKISTHFNSQGVLENDLLFNIVSVPAFNQICTNYEDESCEILAHDPITGLPYPNNDDLWVEGGGDPTYYHLGGIGYFIITCVHGPGLGDCPGQLSLEAANPTEKFDSFNSFEGYFVLDVPEYWTIGPGGLDLGNYIISLTN